MKKKFSIKKIFMAIFGKARWFVLGIVLSILFFASGITFDTAGKWFSHLTDTFEGEEIHISYVSEASVNRDGKAIFTIDKGSNTLSALKDIESNETVYLQVSGIMPRPLSAYTPRNFAIGEGNLTYGFFTVYDESDTYRLAEKLLVFSEKGKVADELCYIEYPKDMITQINKLSDLNYYNGYLYFATVYEDEVKLYKVDANTKNIQISHSYKTLGNGVFTAEVIPVNDYFLFLQSDGKIYKVEFDSPLHDCVCTVESNPLSNEETSYFDLAAEVNGKIYFAESGNNGKVYALESGELKEVLNLDNGREDKAEVVSLDTIGRDDGNEKLVITLSDGLYVFDGTDLTEKNITFFLKNHPIFWVETAVSLFFELCILGLIINLIVRKKTLLYKQLAVTLPVLIIPALLIAIVFYSGMSEDNTNRTEEELELVTRLAVDALDGYDFSELENIDDNTGAASIALKEKISAYDKEKGKFVFSVIAVTKDGEASVLSKSDELIMPGQIRNVNADWKEIAKEGLYSSKTISGLFDEELKESGIYTYSYIPNTKGNANYYLKVSTDEWIFWRSRRNLILKVTGSIFFIVAALIVITILSFLHITRTIKKINNTVGEIASGNLSSRVKYRPKDELGEISSSVNSMATSLQNMFNEKDKTEKFYYKFVPEKFRELLGKDNFTDLSLGDAKSRDLTVLFFDIRSFSVNSEIMTAKENFEFVNVIYGKAGPIVRAHNGFVDKYIGDAVMALFENADDAVLCGIELYKEIVLNKNTAETIGIGDINIGIGIHSGMARIGIVGESERLSGTVISDTVNLSSRLESLTKQYHTAMLVSKDTVDRMSDPDSLMLRYLGEIQVAGVNEVRAVYEVLDCLPEEEKEKRSNNLSDFREAIRLFHLGRKSEAVTILSNLAAEGKNDVVTDMYLDYIENNFKEDTGNVFRFVRK